MEGREVLEISLIENLQRENLNPIEEADGYRRLIEEFGISQEELGARVGKDRTTITNALRLLKLPREVIEQLILEKITAGHGRAILSLETKEKQKELCALIIKRGLSVREAETHAKRAGGRPGRSASPEVRGGELTSQLNTLQNALRQSLATKVQIMPKGKKGKIEIEYYSFEDLDRIVEAILGKSA